MENKFTKYDLNSMNSNLLYFGTQIEHACQLGSNIAKDLFSEDPDEFMILGMGGSAIGADLLKSVIKQATGESIRININRNYDVPTYINNNTLVIASSYSGDTEETLSAFEKAIDKTDKLFAITSGGKLEKICREKDIPFLKIPPGFQPRAALAYSFFGLLYLFINNNLVNDEFNYEMRLSIAELSNNIKKITERYSSHENSNPAFRLANNLFGQIPVVYSSAGLLDSVNMRWRGQFNENAKSLCFGNVLPEMNHNEISGWVLPQDMISRFRIILLRDKSVNSRIKVRLEAIKEIFTSMGLEVDEFYGIGEHFLSRLFDLIHLGDWASYYLAVLNKQDPMAIPLIMKLKEILAKTRTE
ncbi:MAG: bifunctional phosphoglucose/phosphomannose isomerase [Candidatus Kapabacteria bacterium]|nr:bifunctional phosphoglucose/phosphomannose isomerase [Ignavibacteriota bacterium]MCW5885265.1 bifunctional phosphoglucose/phosphomannose isomerase [Candidatus Kapabacteria bacterium]